MRRPLQWLANRTRRPHDEQGTVVETVIIAAGLASLAIATVTVLTLLVNGKLAGISL